jgi:hypothetical protein
MCRKTLSCFFSPRNVGRCPTTYQRNTFLWKPHDGKHPHPCLPREEWGRWIAARRQDGRGKALRLSNRLSAMCRKTLSCFFSPRDVGRCPTTYQRIKNPLESHVGNDMRSLHDCGNTYLWNPAGAWRKITTYPFCSCRMKGRRELLLKLKKE